MRRILIALAALLIPVAAYAVPPSTVPPAGSATVTTADGGVTPRTLGSRAADFFDARDYAVCTWTSGGDVGPCIQAAINVAAAAGGGTVRIPAGIYGMGTTVNQNTPGVHVVGAGVGSMRDTVSPGNYLAVTRLVWNGAAGATMFNVATTGTITLYSADVTGIVFDCASLANTCFHAQQVTRSTFQVGGSEGRLTNILMDTNNIDAYGNQDNDIWFWSRSTSSTYSPTGIQMDSGSGSSYNTSYNRFHVLFAWFAQGDGVVFGNVDNNIIDDLESFKNPSNATGRPIVFANAGYTSPNGVTVQHQAYNQQARHVGSPIYSLGYQTGSTIAAGANSCNGGGAGACGPTTYSLTTNATSGQGTNTLNFAATTGVSIGDAVNCGSGSGVPVYDYINTYTGTTVVVANPFFNQVASSVACTFSYGLTNSAASGTYTITAASGTTFNITAPSGGHSQSAIAVASGHLTFTDIVIPWTGTATAGDTWTVTVPAPSNSITLYNIDKANSVANPAVEPGAGIFFQASNNGLLSGFGPNSNLVSGPVSYGTSAACVALVGFNTTGSNCTGQNGAILGGVGNNIASNSGTGNVIVGGVGNTISNANYGFLTGHSNSIGSFYAGVGGDSNTNTGLDSFVWGDHNNVGNQSTLVSGSYAQSRANDVICHANGGVLGANQHCFYLLRGTGNSTTGIRLTVDGATAGAANCVNLPATSNFTLTIDVNVFDHTTPTKYSVWSNWTGVMNRATTASTTLVNMNATPTPLQVSFAPTISATTDTTNGCLNLTVTPPGGNTDTIDIEATIATVEVQ